MAIRKTAELTQLMKERGIKDEEILYMPIIGAILDRIVSGEKKMEFRRLTEHNINRLWDAKKNDFKPYKYIMFQAGYDAKANRALVKLNEPVTFLFREAEEDGTFPPFNDEWNWVQAQKEGFEFEDEWIGYVFDKKANPILYTEGY